MAICWGLIINWISRACFAPELPGMLCLLNLSTSYSCRGLETSRFVYEGIIFSNFMSVSPPMSPACFQNLERWRDPESQRIVTIRWPGPSILATRNAATPGPRYHFLYITNEHVIYSLRRCYFLRRCHLWRQATWPLLTLLDLPL